MSYHNPVLLFESVDGLEIVSDGIYVDVTFGGGGHSKEILKDWVLTENSSLLIKMTDALENTIDDERFVLIHENFRYLKRFFKVLWHKKVNGILADLGVSSHQFDVASRGFSTRFDAELDMRMSKKAEISAYKVINKYPEEKLSNILFLYGELRNARALAKQIVVSRKLISLLKQVLN